MFESLTNAHKHPYRYIFQCYFPNYSEHPKNTLKSHLRNYFWFRPKQSLFYEGTKKKYFKWYEGGRIKIGGYARMDQVPERDPPDSGHSLGGQCSARAASHAKQKSLSLGDWTWYPIYCPMYEISKFPLPCPHPDPSKTEARHASDALQVQERASRRAQCRLPELCNRPSVRPSERAEKDSPYSWMGNSVASFLPCTHTHGHTHDIERGRRKARMKEKNLLGRFDSPSRLFLHTRRFTSDDTRGRIEALIYYIRDSARVRRIFSKLIENFRKSCLVNNVVHWLSL